MLQAVVNRLSAEIKIIIGVLLLSMRTIELCAAN